MLGRPSLAVRTSACPRARDRRRRRCACGGCLCLFAWRHGVELWWRVRVPERQGRRDAEWGGGAIGVRGRSRRGKVGRAVVVRREGRIGLAIGEGVAVVGPRLVQTGRVGVGVGVGVGRRMPRGERGEGAQQRPEMLGRTGGGEGRRVARAGEREGEGAAVRAHGRRGRRRRRRQARWSVRRGRVQRGTRHEEGGEGRPGGEGRARREGRRGERCPVGGVYVRARGEGVGGAREGEAGSGGEVAAGAHGALVVVVGALCDVLVVLSRGLL